MQRYALNQSYVCHLVLIVLCKIKVLLWLKITEKPWDVSIMLEEAGKSMFNPFHKLVASSLLLCHLGNYMGITVM